MAKKDSKVSVDTKNSPRGLESSLKVKGIAILGGAVILILALTMCSMPERDDDKSGPARVNVNESDMAEASWQAKSQAKVDAARRRAIQAEKAATDMQGKYDKQRDVNRDLFDRMADLDKKMRDRQDRVVVEREERNDRDRGDRNNKRRSSSDDNLPPPDEVADNSDGDDRDTGALPPPPPRPPVDMRGDYEPRESGKRQSQSIYEHSSSDSDSNREQAFIFAPPIPEDKLKKKSDDEHGQLKKNKYAGYLPGGSFADAVLLTGVDAGASQQTQSNPQPVLIRMNGSANTPGDGDYDLSNCTIIGSAYGDMSAERAYIRTARLSCLDTRRGLVLEAQISGYLADSDGFQGLRGKVVRRNGQLLAKSLLAGLAQGISEVGRAASDNARDRIISPNNNRIGGYNEERINMSSGDLAQASLFGGTANAADQLADYYLEEAKSIFPVVSIPPGRKVTVVITEGTSLEWSRLGGKYVREITPKG